MFDSPKSHDCFRHIQMYNVDFYKYELRHRCNDCGFGSNSGVMMRKHACFRTPIPRDFPTSQDNLTPPHVVFEGQSSQLASQHSSMPVASELNEENIENDVATQDSLTSAVSLVDEINSPADSAPGSSTAIPQNSNIPQVALWMPPCIPRILQALVAESWRQIQFILSFQLEIF